MTKTVEVFSDGICYWLRWLAVFVAFAIFYWLGFYVQEQAPALTFLIMMLMAIVGGIVLAIVQRPRSYRVILEKDALVVERIPGRRPPTRIPLPEIRYLTVRNTGHLFNLSVLQIVVRTKRGSLFFGPIYKQGIDALASAEIGRLLPRIPRRPPSPRRTVLAENSDLSKA